MNYERYEFEKKNIVASNSNDYEQQVEELVKRLEREGAWT